MTKSQQEHKKGSVRHAEKRRISTCTFADRVAAISKEAYHQRVPSSWRDHNPQTCVATIVAHFDDEISRDGENSSNAMKNENLEVLAMGVGTKFLSHDTLRQDQQSLGATVDGISTGFDNHEDTNICDKQKFEDDPLGHLNLRSYSSSCNISYGQRVRDCHAEVLARRAFRSYLTSQMKSLLLRHDKQQQEQKGNELKDPTSYTSFPHTSDLPRQILTVTNRLPSLENPTNSIPSPRVMFSLKEGVTLHMYSSSAPCGNATLKKFAKLSKEVFQPDLDENTWPQLEGTNTDNNAKDDEECPHEPIPPHSMKLGQFSLLLKKDMTPTCNIVTTNVDVKDNTHHELKGEDEHIEKRQTQGIKGEKIPTVKTPSKKKMAIWPAQQNDAWCPPGTTITTNFDNKDSTSSIHTCSDKLCRWNCIGLQGSLLSSLFDKPLHMSTLTVGRKFSNIICRRAVCCRAFGYHRAKKKRRMNRGNINAGTDTTKVAKGGGSVTAHANGNNLGKVTSECEKTLVSTNPDHHDSSSTSPCHATTHQKMETEKDHNIINKKPMYVSSTDDDNTSASIYKLNHPAIMCTAVYLDENGVLDMSGVKTIGNDVRFQSNSCWVWSPLPSIPIEDETVVKIENSFAECVNGETGLIHREEKSNHTIEKDQEKCSGTSGTHINDISTVSTFMLTNSFLHLWKAVHRYNGDSSFDKQVLDDGRENYSFSLQELAIIKQRLSSTYEKAKDELLQNHRIFRQWKRRRDH